MNSLTRRRDDRSAPDSFKQRAPSDKYPHDYDPERRRHRAVTVPSHSYDARSYPSHDPRYNDPRQSSRSNRQDPRYPSAVHHSSSYHPPSAQAPPTSRAYQHATRTPAQHPSSAYHNPQPSSYQPSHSTPVYPVASSSRRPHPEASDPRAPRRTAAPANQSYEHVSGGEDMARAPKHTSRPIHSSSQPPLPVASNQAFWNPPQDISSSRRNKDLHRDHEGDQERDKDRDRGRGKLPAEFENKYKDKTRTERHREREHERERTTEVRYQEPGRSRHHDRRKESDTEEALYYAEQRNASKASFSGREGYSAVRESSNAHRRYRTEDGIASTGRRHQPENVQNSITTVPSHPIVPQPDMQQTGEPPPAPRVMPVYLPPKAKPQRSQREGRPSTAQGAQSSSDTERATGKHRMERIPSGPAVQRSDTYTSTSMRDRGNHDTPVAPRDDAKGKYGTHQDIRQPLAPINVDIPLVTPGFSASALPTETKVPTQIVSIRAGQGPSDPHDVQFKSSTVSRSDAPQDIFIHPPASASIVKSSSRTRLQSSEARAQPDRPVAVEHLRTEPRVDDPPPGQRVSIHESSRALSTPISKPSYPRGNPDSGVDNPSSSYPHSRPPSRSAHRSSINNVVPPPVIGPRPLRSASQGQQTNEPPTRPPSVAQYVPTISSAPNQHSGLQSQSPANPTTGSPRRAGHTHGSSSAQPSPKNAQLHGVTLSHSTSTQQASSVPPSAHPTPIVIPQTFTTSSRPSTRDGSHTGAPPAHQQSIDRQSTADVRSGHRQTSNNATVETSWVVQTPATAKKISRDDKYLRDHRFNSEMPHVQLRQMLSQEDDVFPRASLSMMKTSQVTTPTTSSQRNSPGTRARDVPFSMPRGTSTSNSPRSGSTKEAPTPEHIPRQGLPPHLAGPPQIAVVGATPVTGVRDLPHGRVDSSFLAPPLPAPTRASRTSSGSQDPHSQPPQPILRNTPSTPHQPSLAPAMHAPSLFQPYRPSSLPTPEDNGQFSPPPLPIPPPKGPEDSPPPLIETRTSEIIPTRSQSDERPRSYTYSIPEVQSEMFHMPLPAPIPSQLPSAPLLCTTQSSQPTKLDGNILSMSALNGSVATAQAEARSTKLGFAQPSEVPVVHQEIMLSVAVLPSQSSTPARPRPKVTIEDVPEDSPVLSKPIPTTAPATTLPALVSRPTTLANTNTTLQSILGDQPAHKSSPQSQGKDTLQHSVTQPIGMPTAPPMPVPTSATAPLSTRVPSSAPLAQPNFSSFQAPPVQRATSNTLPSHTYQRATEMMQASKLSTSVGANSGTAGSFDKVTAVPAQTMYTSASTVPGQHQPVNDIGLQGPSSSRPINATTTVSLSGTTAMTSTTKATAPSTMIASGSPVGALGLHLSTVSTTVNTHPSAPESARQQLTRPGPWPIPSVDAPFTTIMSTAPVKNIHQDHPVTDSTRPRDAPSATRNILPSSHTYSTSTRPSTFSTMTQQTHVTPGQPSTHNRAVSLPTTTSSLATQKPPSPRKYLQPMPSATVSTQQFPSQAARVYTPAAARSARVPFPERTNDPDILKTPSSIAPSPMLNPDTSNQSIAIPIRTRLSSTDSKDDKKKPSGLFGIFRTRTLSSKATDPPAASTVPRASLDQARVLPDAPVTPSSTTFTSRGMTSTAAIKEMSSVAPPAASIPTNVRTPSKFKGRVPDSITISHPPTQAIREPKDVTTHIFSPFKYLSMHSKRNRTVSAASLDVCDGNTATNTVIGSPDHSTISQVQPLPPIIPPDVRDPLVATSEWRDREEAERRERRANRIRRPGVTFDVEEEPPSPAPGTANRRKRLVRRGSGRAPTPGPSRG